MVLEVIVLRERVRERQMLCDVTYTWSLNKIQQTHEYSKKGEWIPGCVGRGKTEVGQAKAQMAESKAQGSTLYHMGNIANILQQLQLEKLKSCLKNKIEKYP